MEPARDRVQRRVLVLAVLNLQVRYVLARTVKSAESKVKISRAYERSYSYCNVTIDYNVVKRQALADERAFITTESTFSWNTPYSEDSVNSGKILIWTSIGHVPVSRCKVVPVPSTTTRRRTEAWSRMRRAPKNTLPTVFWNKATRMPDYVPDSYSGPAGIQRKSGNSYTQTSGWYGAVLE
jgi:hypothetical protein